MTSRSNECYTAVFKYIEQHIFELKPDEIITDFEAGLRIAVNQYYPRAILRGCWYHYCAKIREKFSKLGLSTLIKNNPFARLIKYELMNLPLLPAEYFSQGYSHIQRLARNHNLEGQLRKIFEYFDYWIEQVLSHLWHLSLFISCFR